MDAGFYVSQGSIWRACKLFLLLVVFLTAQQNYFRARALKGFMRKQQGGGDKINILRDKDAPIGCNTVYLENSETK